MYSLILMTAMSAAPHGPEFGGAVRNWFGRGCTGCYGSCDGRSYGCYGADRPGLGSRLRAAFSFGGCRGCYGSCAGRAGYACSGGVALSCSGGMMFDGYPSGGEFGGPMYPGTAVPSGPFLPGTIPPAGGPPLDGVPFAPNTPAPPPAVIEDRYSPRVPGGLASASANRGTVVVRLPADAKLYAEGRLLQLTSAERTFVTPELPGGREYTYTFKVEYDRNGETVTQARRVTVQPGKATAVEFVDLVAGAGKPTVPGPTELATKPAAPGTTTATKPAEPAPAADRPANPFKAPAVAPHGAADRARITVKLPPGATLYVDEAKKDGAGPVREFTTPPLPAGKEFAYLMTVEVIRNGLPERLIEKVTFRAGETITRDFAAVFPADQRAGR